MVKDYHEIFAATSGRHREASCLMGGKFSSDLNGLDEDLVASELGFASVRNWQWRGGAPNFLWTGHFFGLIEMSL